MKIASYNIMSGGFADYSHTSPKPERLDAIRAVVKDINADVIGLIDTFRWDETFSDQDLRDLFGYAHILRTNLNDARLAADGGKSIGVVIMSRQQWVDSSVVRLNTRDALNATFEINNKEISLFLTYLDHRYEDERVKQAKALLGYVKNQETTVIMGDLNTFAVSDIASVTRDVEVFYVNNPKMKANLEPVITDMQRGEVITLLESHGFKDAGSKKGPTIPSRLFPAVVTRPFLRVDYCLSGSDVNVRDFNVRITDDTHIASDHFPISFTVS